jgi:hypothetical protein
VGKHYFLVRMHKARRWGQHTYSSDPGFPLSARCVLWIWSPLELPSENNFGEIEFHQWCNRHRRRRCPSFRRLWTRRGSMIVSYPDVRSQNWSVKNTCTVPIRTSGDFRSIGCRSPACDLYGKSENSVLETSTLSSKRISVRNNLALCIDNYGCKKEPKFPRECFNMQSSCDSEEIVQQREQ